MMEKWLMQLTQYLDGCWIKLIWDEFGSFDILEQVENFNIFGESQCLCFLIFLSNFLIIIGLVSIFLNGQFWYVFGLIWENFESGERKMELEHIGVVISKPWSGVWSFVHCPFICVWSYSLWWYSVSWPYLWAFLLHFLDSYPHPIA